jgi:hypothetical protein
LEKKIDGIVSLLAANQRQNLSPLTPESPKEQTHTQPQSQTQPISIPSLSVSPSSLDMISRESDIPPNFTAGAELFPGFRVSHRQASERLALYKRDYVPHFPFVPLPGIMTSQELYIESSLLFWTILAVVSPLEDKVQMEFKAWFRRYLAEHLIVRQEKSVDILQAMLIYLGW